MATDKSKTYFLDVFLHLLPILLIFYFFAFPDSFRQQAMTFLGRSVLVLYILLFSYISIWLGTLYCIGLILYLQAIHSTPSNQTSADKATLLQQWSEMINPVRPTTSPYVPTTSPYVPTQNASTHRPRNPPIVGASAQSSQSYNHVSYEAKPTKPRRRKQNQGGRPNQSKGDRPNKNKGDRPRDRKQSQGDRPRDRKQSQGDRPRDRKQSQGDRPRDRKQSQGDRPPQKKQSRGTRVPKQNPM